MYFISGWPLTGVDLRMGRGEGSKRGIKGTLPSLHFKPQLAQHSRTVRCNFWLWGFISSASWVPGRGPGCPWALELLGIQWKALCCQVPRIQTWGAGWGWKIPLFSARIGIWPLVEVHSLGKHKVCGIFPGWLCLEMFSPWSCAAVCCWKAAFL